jgi:hypothetical protein
MSSFSTSLLPLCNTMANTARLFPRVPSTHAQNAILSLRIIHIIPSRQIYVAIDNPTLIPSISRFTTICFPQNYASGANNVSHVENMPHNSCLCFFHRYKFRDGILVTRVFRDCGERLGEPVLKGSSIHV